ncbi:hypothetical protein M569_01509, partial [Genlisea aurea]
ADTDAGDRTDTVDETNTSCAVQSAVARSLSSLISSLLTDLDSRAGATACSQDQLTSALDRLTAELDVLLDDAPSPFMMQQATRICTVRSRVKALNTVLKSIQRRIDNMDQMLSSGTV